MISRSTTRIAAALVGLTWCLLVFGSTVRVHEAGLACPDWPLCFGVVVPDYRFDVYLEFGHRVLAGVVSLIFGGLAVHLWRRGAFAARPALRSMVLFAGAALLIQVVLGGLTVLELLAEWTVASHLLVGNTFCAALLLIALALADSGSARPAIQRWQRAPVFALFALVPLQIVLGGLVSGSHAGLACGTWPSCNGAGWFPTFSGLVGLQVVHRAVAYTLGGVVLLNAVAQRRSPRLARPAGLLVGFVALQIVLGVSNVLLLLPMEITLAHSACAAWIALTTTWLGYEALRAPVAAASWDPAPSGALPLEAK